MNNTKTLDFKPATDNLNSVLFDVQLVDLLTSSTGLFSGNSLDKIKVIDYNAVVNVKNREILCVVSSQYHLITNKQALELGKKAFVKLFPSVKESDLIPYKVISSSRKTFCHIDLVHNSVNFNVWEQDTWLPFIRITNSYNRTHKLSFELGFVRKLCLNGVIFDKKTVKVKYTHSKGQIPTEIIADISKLKSLEADFISQLSNLKRFHIAPKLVFPLVCKSLKLNWNFDSDNNPNLQKALEQYNDLKTLSKKLAKSYIEKEGQNAYAAA